MEDITLRISKDGKEINLRGEGLTVDYTRHSLAAYVYKDFIYKALTPIIRDIGVEVYNIINSIDHVVRSYLESDGGPLEHKGFVFEFVRKEV